MPFLTLPNQIFLEISDWLSLRDQCSLFSTNGHLSRLLPHVLFRTAFRTRSKEYARGALYALASRNDLSGVLTLLNCGILSFTGSAASVITGAIKTNNEVTLRTLLDGGVSATGIDEDREWTPFQVAAITGNAAMMKVLLSKDEYGIDVNETWEGVLTPLMYAIMSGAPEAVRVLLEHHGIEVNALASDGRSALQCAIMYNEIGALKLLLEDSRVDLGTPNGNTMTVLMAGVDCGHVEALELLLQSPRIDVSDRSLDGRTPLHVATYRTDTTILEILLKQSRININAADTSGCTALHEASRFSAAAVQMLLHDGRADVNARNIGGCTPLHMAVLEENMATIRVLLQDLRVDIFIKNNEGQTPLSIARNLDVEDIAPFMLEEYYRRGEESGSAVLEVGILEHWG
ncbi:ankyrin repeat-containing domain protein [Tuber indicum]|nr:ankyrin repeat-containing domain protein [Tuber indicum]